MTIAYCILGTFNAGGMERVLTMKANYLASRGYHVFIVTTDQSGRQPFFNLASEVSCYDLDINYTQLKTLPLSRKLPALFRKKRTHRNRLKILLNEIRPDVTISLFDHDADFLHSIEAGGAKIAEIHFSRLKFLQYGRTGIMGLADRYRSIRAKRLAARYQRFVVLTEEDADLWGAGINLRVIPNPTNMVPPDACSNLVAPQALAVGRLTYQKNFEDLLYAWTRVKKAGIAWQLNVFGSGENHSKLVSLARTLGLEESVNFCEPSNDMDRVYREHSIFLLTSRFEGLPMVLLEASAYGLPMVSYACQCGPRDVITEGINGFLTVPGDFESFADKVIALAGDNKLRKEMGEAAHRLSYRYDINTVMPMWIQLFEEVTG